MLKNLKLILLTVACMALVSLAISGTLADLNEGVEFKIEQIQLMRATSTDDADSYGLTQYVNGQMLIPSNVDKAEYATAEQSWPNGSSNKLFSSSMEDVIDQFVFIKNTGTETAYVRTWFAFEQGSVSTEEFNDIFLLNVNDEDWSWNTYGTVTIEGYNYFVMFATCKGGLESGKTSDPSLMQIALSSQATAITCNDLDGNSDGYYNVIVKSEAYSDDATIPVAQYAVHPWLISVDQEN